MPESLKAVLWFDGDIGQLQKMLYEAREVLDDAERICRNKHLAAATGTQQQCDVSQVFLLLQQLQKILTARDNNACGLAEDIDKFFTVHLRKEKDSTSMVIAVQRGLWLFSFCVCLRCWKRY